MGRAARHQVIDLPESAVVTTEHELLKVCCPGCGAHTRAKLPAGVERGAFGPRLRATVVMLAVMLMSRRATKLMLADMLGATGTLSTGSVEKILKDASSTLAEPWEAIKRAVQAGEVAHADETSWRRAGQRIWLWEPLTSKWHDLLTPGGNPPEHPSENRQLTPRFQFHHGSSSRFT